MATILRFPGGCKKTAAARGDILEDGRDSFRSMLLSLPAVSEAEPAKRATPLSRAQLIPKLREEFQDHDEEQLSRMADLLIAFNAKVLACADPG